MDRPLVSIALITYKHENYIQEAMDGIMMQEGIEDFEIVVGDDHSPDRTVEIIEECTKSHSNTRFLQRPSNVGMHQNWLDTIRACKGKYIALIEGDDVWTDPQKLKKQVEVLEADDSISVCFTDASVINEMDDGVTYGTYLEHQEIDQNRSRFTSEDLCDQNFISTVTVMIRNTGKWAVSKHYFESPFVDWIILLLTAMRGDLQKLTEVTSSYRIHPSGAFGYSVYELRKRNMVKVLRCLYHNLPKGKEKELIFSRYLLSIEELAQYLKSVSGKQSLEFYKLKTVRKINELVGSPVLCKLV